MAKTKDTDESEGQAVRQRLLQAALDLFTEKGYASTSVREIVDAAGVTKPVLYYYFKSKEGIYLELFREPFAFFSQILEDARHGEGGVRARVVRLFDRIFALFVARLKVARLMYSIYYGPPQGAPFFDFEGFHLKMQGGYRAYRERGDRKGGAKGCRCRCRDMGTDRSTELRHGGTAVSWLPDDRPHWFIPHP